MGKKIGKQFLLVVIIILQVACNSTTNKKESTNYAKLVPSGDVLRISIDSITSIDCSAMFYYRNGKKELLTYLNSYKNEIQFYDLNTKQLVHKVTCEMKGGPDAVGKITGYKVINLDSIYLTVGQPYHIYLVDSLGRIKKKYIYGKTEDMNIRSIHLSTSRVYTPLVVKDKKLFLTQDLSFEIPFLPKNIKMPTPNNKVCLVINEEGVNAYMPMEHPLKNEEGLNKGSARYSREFDGNNFIYSFFKDPNIYVTIDHINIMKYDATSQYVGKMKFTKYKSMPTIEEVSKEFVNGSFYYNLIYDPFRNVYYRFVKLSDNVKKNGDLSKKVKYPQNFSIVILNKNFQVIGESRFPEKTYVFQDSFVANAGLYISINHIDNANLDIDTLQFELIKLQFNEN